MVNRFQRFLGWRVLLTRIPH